MPKELSPTFCEVLSAGYTHHTKPFQAASRKGLRNYLIRFQTEGRCRALVNGQLELIQPGDLLMYKPGDIYDLRVDTEQQANGETAVFSGDYYFFCRGSWLDQWWNKSPKPQKAHIPLSEDILNLLRHASLEQQRVKGRYKEISDYYLRILCLSIERILSEQQFYSTKGKSFLAVQMKSYIEEHALTPIRLEDVAQHVGLSVSRAVHLFKSIFGQSIMQYTLQIRLSIARERILFSKMSLEQIAEASGFNSYTYFYRMFKSRYGMSPKAFRHADSEEQD
ncbi:AraC family transcriptional regulator [Paenibacillus koleovorans]|uniref:AraC family transcriptional regulator n=1 Tax=Paenibacillus koleovorans TaxID=121608 RepID=UPI000FD8F0C4|nr:AraC family transcriptional regulator [Paenibacillus koleovorans]